jgi:hypothetical protein
MTEKGNMRWAVLWCSSIPLSFPQQTKPSHVGPHRHRTLCQLPTIQHSAVQSSLSSSAPHSASPNPSASFLTLLPPPMRYLYLWEGVATQPQMGRWPRLANQGQRPWVVGSGIFPISGDYGLYTRTAYNVLSFFYLKFETLFNLVHIFFLYSLYMHFIPTDFLYK